MPLYRFFLLLSLATCVLRAQTTPPACTGLCLQQVQCPAGSSTTVTGTVYAPNGTDPIPNVTVYIPNGSVAPLPSGVTCPAPGELPSGSPLVGAFTAADGTFTLNNVPVGNGIPIVILAGKWRRQLTIPGTVACGNTQFNARFPKNQSEGDIPKFAISTGSQDQVECVLRKVGIDDTEFTNPGGSGRIQLFQANDRPGVRIDGNTPSATALMGNQSTLKGFDVLMLPCEGAAYNEPAVQLANLVNYANSGGRVYGSHYAYEWLASNPPFNTVANWANDSRVNYAGPLPATVDPTFPGGATLSKWLQIVGASPGNGKIDLSVIRKDINGVNAPTQSWLTLDQSGGIMQFTFATPVGQASGQCGRVLFNEYHVENPPAGSSPGTSFFPAECPQADMTPQEKLLEYSLFDLANNGGPATISPSSLDFGNQVVGFSTPSQPFLIRNNSVFTATLASSSVSGDFLITGNTCSSVIAGATCAIQVAFKPTDVGPRTGSLLINFGGTELSAALKGTGIAPLAFSTSNLDFGSVDVGSPSSKTITLSNLAPGPVPTSGLNLTGDFKVATTCPAVLASGANCPLLITFTPGTTGPRTGSITGPGIATALTGNGIDFALSMSPASGSVIAGLPKSYLLTTSPIAGFAAPVNLRCTTDAPGSTCSIASSAFTPSSPVTTTISLTTTSQYTIVGYGIANHLMLIAASFSTGLLLFRKRFAGNRLLMTGMVLLGVSGLSLGLTGCSGKLPEQQANYTPGGTYSFTITATDGILTHSAVYQLTVAAK